MHCTGILRHHKPRFAVQAVALCWHQHVASFTHHLVMVPPADSDFVLRLGVLICALTCVPRRYRTVSGCKPLCTTFLSPRGRKPPAQPTSSATLCKIATLSQRRLKDLVLHCDPLRSMVSPRSIFPSAPPRCRAGRYIGGRSDPLDRRRLLKLLVDPTEGLGLTRLRYQIPPPFTPPGSPGVWASYDHDWTSYLPAKGKYNLSADWKQVLAVQVRPGAPATFRRPCRAPEAFEGALKGHFMVPRKEILRPFARAF